MPKVKLEGGAKRLESCALYRLRFPATGHLGLTPQSANVMGGFKVQGRTKCRSVTAAR